VRATSECEEESETEIGGLLASSSLAPPPPPAAASAASAAAERPQQAFATSEASEEGSLDEQICDAEAALKLLTQQKESFDQQIHEAQAKLQELWAIVGENGSLATAPELQAGAASSGGISADRGLDRLD